MYTDPVASLLRNHLDITETKPFVPILVDQSLFQTYDKLIRDQLDIKDHDTEIRIPKPDELNQLMFHEDNDAVEQFERNEYNTKPTDTFCTAS